MSAEQSRKPRVVVDATSAASPPTAHRRFRSSPPSGSRAAGKRRKRGFATRAAAEEHLAKVRASMADGTLAVARRAEALFTDVGDEWLRLHSATLRSHRENQIRWKHRIKPFFSGLTLAAVTSSKVLEFKAALLAESGLADGTRNQYLQQTRAVLRYAVAAGYITAAPTERIPGLMIRVRRAKLAPPIERPEDVGRLLEAVREVSETEQCPLLPCPRGDRGFHRHAAGRALRAPLVRRRPRSPVARRPVLARRADQERRGANGPDCVGAPARTWPSGSSGRARPSWCSRTTGPGAGALARCTRRTAPSASGSPWQRRAAGRSSGQSASTTSVTSTPATS